MVKFGDHLVSNLVVEWSTKYISYKKLKKLLKVIRNAREAIRLQNQAYDTPLSYTTFFSPSHLHDIERCCIGGSGGKVFEKRAKAEADNNKLVTNDQVVEPLALVTPIATLPPWLPPSPSFPVPTPTPISHTYSILTCTTVRDVGLPPLIHLLAILCVIVLMINPLKRVL
jgi:hypothetical protein